MAEHGVKEDLGLIRQVEKAPPFPAEDIVQLLEIAEERISERVYGELQNFFNLSQEEFARITDTTDAVENLRSIKESLEALFDPEEVRRWLHTPKSMFAGRTPIVSSVATTAVPALAHHLARATLRAVHQRNLSRTGTLWDSRYKSSLVQEDTY